MRFCTYIASYRDIYGTKVSVFQRDHYLYELTQGVKTIRWFNDMSLDEVTTLLHNAGYVSV